MRRYLDELTTACTAFEGYLGLVMACRDGYIPTVPPTTRRNRILARVLRARGFAVYTG